MQRSLTGFKKNLLALGLVLACLVPTWGAALPGKPNVPKPVGWVNDFSKALSEQDKARLNNISTVLEQATGAELVYLIMPSIAPYDDQEYGMAVFDAWHIGKKGKDNGLLILLALKERRIRIITGYGVEGILPDGKLGRYRDQYLVPQLRAGKMGDGLALLGTVIAQDIAKEAGVTLSGAAGKPVRRKQPQIPYGLLLFLLLIFISGLLRSGRRRRTMGGVFIPGGFYGSGGGGFGGGFGGFGGGFSGGGGVGGSW